MKKIDKSQLPDKRLFESFDLFLLALLDVDPKSFLVEMASLYGQETAMSMVDLFGGTVIKVPTKEAVMDAVKRACIWRDFSAGKSSQELSDEYNVSGKKVYAIVERYRQLTKVEETGNV